MAPRRTPAGFQIHDLLTRVTPGVIFLIIAFGSVVFREPTLPSQNLPLYLIGLAILSLLIGEAIDYLAGLFYRPPTSFKRFLYEQGVDVQLGTLDSIRQNVPRLSVGKSFVYTRTGEDFWDLFTSHFHVREDYNNVHDIYNILLGYMETRMSPRVQRLQTVFHFVNNTLFSIIAGSAVVLLRVIGDYLQGNLSEFTILWSVLIAFSAVFVVYALTVIFGYQESEYVTNLIVEYYVDRVEAGEVEKVRNQVHQQTLDGIKSESK